MVRFAWACNYSRKFWIETSDVSDSQTGNSGKINRVHALWHATSLAETAVTAELRITGSAQVLPNGPPRPPIIVSRERHTQTAPPAQAFAANRSGPAAPANPPLAQPLHQRPQCFGAALSVCLGLRQRVAAVVVRRAAKRCAAGAYGGGRVAGGGVRQRGAGFVAVLRR